MVHDFDQLNALLGAATTVHAHACGTAPHGAAAARRGGHVEPGRGGRWPRAA